MSASQEYTFLKIFIDNDDELKSIYKNAVDKHNTAIKSSNYPDAGFDLYVPKDYLIKPGDVGKIDFKIITAASSSLGTPLSFFTYPRSSIYKTPLRLANSVGIIDSDYVDPVFVIVQNTSNRSITFKNGTRICQGYMDMLPLYHLVEVLEKPLQKTDRDGGFGSTGTK